MKEQTTICEISINYKPARKISQLPCIKVSKDVYSYFKQLWSDKIDYTEEMYLMLLNRANKVLGYVLLSKGGTTGTVVDPKMVFQAALKANAHALILCHNHPSGNLQPSEADIRLTKNLKNAGLFLEIPLLDHLIITSESFFSFADEGMI